MGCFCTVQCAVSPEGGSVAFLHRRPFEAEVLQPQLPLATLIKI